MKFFPLLLLSTNPRLAERCLLRGRLHERPYVSRCREQLRRGHHIRVAPVKRPIRPGQERAVAPLPALLFGEVLPPCAVRAELPGREVDAAKVPRYAGVPGLVPL